MRYILVALLALLFASPAYLPAQGIGFYALDTIQQISLTFPFSNWDYRLDTAQQGSEGYILATQCVINGVSFDSVGVKYKGNSSYNANNAKNPFHIKLDWVVGSQDYQGYEDIKLGNGFKDPSMIREVLGYKTVRQYMHAPLSNFALVWANGSLLGLYSNSQDVGNAFTGEHFYSSGNAFFKCNPVYSGGNNPDLRYLGADSSLYFNKYELQSAIGWKQLVHLCDTLNNNPSVVEEILDVDRALWMLAFDNVTVNLDSYIGAIKQNYYLYRDGNMRFNPVVWDLNECFGTFTNTGSGPPLDLNGMINMSHLLHSTDTNWPLIYRLLGNRRWKRMYIAHMRTILDENYANGLYQTWAADLQAIIDSAVQIDLNKFYTYAQFQNAMTQNVSGMGTIPGIANLMGPRTTYLQSQSDFTAQPPVISAITPSNASPALGDVVTITAQISGTPTYARLGYRDHVSARFTYAQMYDDGQHGDGNAGDGIYGADMTCSSSEMQYYLYAENNNAGAFSPVRAEHEFHLLAVSIPPVSPGQVVLNELMADNVSSYADPSGEYDDWVELYNNTGSAISLAGLYLSDDAALPMKWPFPGNVSIPAWGYLIVWCDQDEFQGGLHANFKLSAAGEHLRLSAGSAVLDSVTFGFLPPDGSYSRCPNATGPWEDSWVTPNAVNICLLSVPEGMVDDPAVWPNPSTGIVQVRTGSARVQVLNAWMQRVDVPVQARADNF